MIISKILTWTSISRDETQTLVTRFWLPWAVILREKVGMLMWDWCSDIRLVDALQEIEIL